MNPKYTSLIDVIRDIEQNNKVEEIQYNNVQVWPVLRIYITDAIRESYFYRKSRQIKVNSSTIKVLFKSVFYGFSNILNNPSNIIFSTADLRKNVNGFQVDRVMEGVMDYFESDYLVIEKPVPVQHKSKDEILNKKVMSFSVLFFLEFIHYYIISRVVKNKIYGAHILNAINKSYNLNFNYSHQIKRFNAQTFAAKVFFGFKKPKRVFMVAPYINAGYIHYFKSRNITVVEMQHGIINDKHYAYNISRKFSSNLFPDFLFTYSSFEINILSRENNFFIDKNRMISVGNYLLNNYINSHGNLNSGIEAKEEIIITISGQEDYETEMLATINWVAKNCSQVVFYYVPRRQKKTYNILSDRLVIKENQNIYELISLSDAHLTVSSTCAYEAQLIGKYNILLDINGAATRYYQSILDKEMVSFVKDKEELLRTVESIINNRRIINPNNKIFPKESFRSNLDLALTKIKNFTK